MKKGAENQVCGSLSPFRYYLPYVVLALVSILACTSNSLFSLIRLAVTVLVISYIFLFKINKRKPILEVHEVKDETMEEAVEEPPQEVLQQENETSGPLKETPKDVFSEVHGKLVQSPDLSESETIDLSSTSEDSDVDWPFQIPTCSEDSIPDDDSLIEIALPEGHYISTKEEYKSILPKKLPEFLPESIFGQEGLMELLAEINEMYEEENLIEIDISIGSIKCSRLEIKA